MSWLGKWRNQYGSIIDITNERDQKIAGMFRTALKDSGFFGQQVEVHGIHQGECINFAAGGRGPAGDMIVSYTGLLREGRMETLWFVVADATLTASAAGVPAEIRKLNAWRAMTIHADTFERI
jgi:hypothetical protein